MKVSGAADVHASTEAVLAALKDPGLLVRAVPGLDQIAFADGRCRFTLTAAVAAVSGSYAGEARVVERPEAGVRVLRVSATGVKGKIGADVTIRLAPASDGATEISYIVDADVDGAIAGIGQRMLASIARRLATDAIGGIDAALAHPADVAPPDIAAAGADDSRAAIERARRGIGLRGHRVPAIGRPAPAVVRNGLLAGAAAAVAGIAVGVVLRKRRGRR